MQWLVWVLGAVLAWGMYGVALHRGQVLLGNPMRALLCVGFAYFLIEILAENSLDDYCLSSPAISDGQIFIRTGEYLYCIGDRAGGASE